MMPLGGENIYNCILNGSPLTPFPEIGVLNALFINKINIIQLQGLFPYTLLSKSFKALVEHICPLKCL